MKLFDRNNENYIYEVVSKNIKKQRKLKGLTQEQLAQKIAYSTQFISNIESKNHQTFSLGTLWRFSRVLDIDIKELFNEEFQAWAHGPANPDIYNLYKHYGFSAIDKPDGSIPTLDKALIDFLYEIWNTYGIFDGKYLELLTHKELPWIEARGNCKEGEPCSNIIRKETMKSFFSEKINGN